MKVVGGNFVIDIIVASTFFVFGALPFIVYNPLPERGLLFVGVCLGAGLGLLMRGFIALQNGEKVMTDERR